MLISDLEMENQKDTFRSSVPDRREMTQRTPSPRKRTLLLGDELFLSLLHPARASLLDRTTCPGLYFLQRRTALFSDTVISAFRAGSYQQGTRPNTTWSINLCPRVTCQAPQDLCCSHHYRLRTSCHRKPISTSNHYTHFLVTN